MCKSVNIEILVFPMLCRGFKRKSIISDYWYVLIIGSEYCADMLACDFKTSAKLRDKHCSKHQGYICEIPKGIGIVYLVFKINGIGLLSIV